MRAEVNHPSAPAGLVAVILLTFVMATQQVAACYHRTTTDLRLEHTEARLDMAIERLQACEGPAGILNAAPVIVSAWEYPSAWEARNW